MPRVYLAKAEKPLLNQLRVVYLLPVDQDLSFAVSLARAYYPLIVTALIPEWGGHEAAIRRSVIVDDLAGWN